MDKQLYNAAAAGNKDIFTNSEVGDEYFVRKTPEKNNIIHIAIRLERLEFIKEAVKRFPELIYEANSDDDNPLHLATQIGNVSIMKLLVRSYKEYIERAADLQFHGVQPWRARNKEGNTPLHEAIIRCHVNVALFLVEEDGHELARICNNFMEAPLHLAVKHYVHDDPEAIRKTVKRVFMYVEDDVVVNIPYHRGADSISLIELLLEKGRSVACWRDMQGSTPLLRAAALSPPHFPTIEAIIEQCPESTEARDDLGRTMLHLMKKLSRLDDYSKLFALNPAVEALKNYQDKDGNTPLHIALMNQDMGLFCILLKSGANNLRVKNKEDVSVADLIRQQSNDIWNLYDFEQSIGLFTSKRSELGLQLSGNVLEAIETMEHKYVQQALNKRLNNKECTELAESYQQIIELCPGYLHRQFYNSKFGNILHIIIRSAPEIVNKRFLANVTKSYES